MVSQPIWQNGTRCTGDNRDGVLMVPVKGVYDRYLDFVLESWKDEVKIWEMSNEPGLLIHPPAGHAKWFIDLCRYTYETIKRVQPDSIVLGNGVTGDFGMNIVGWCSQLNRENPDYVNWLDGVAFHPYNCGLGLHEWPHLPLPERHPGYFRYAEGEKAALEHRELLSADRLLPADQLLCEQGALWSK